MTSSTSLTVNLSTQNSPKDLHAGTASEFVLPRLILHFLFFHSLGSERGIPRAGMRLSVAKFISMYLINYIRIFFNARSYSVPFDSAHTPASLEVCATSPPFGADLELPWQPVGQKCKLFGVQGPRNPMNDFVILNLTSWLPALELLTILGATNSSNVEVEYSRSPGKSFG